MNSFEKFQFDVSSLKKDFEIEKINVTQNDIDILRQYADNKITINQIVDKFKQSNQGEIKSKF